MNNHFHRSLFLVIFLLGSSLTYGQSDSLRNILNVLKPASKDSTLTGSATHGNEGVSIQKIQSRDTIVNGSSSNQRNGEVKIIAPSSIDSLEKAQRGRSELRGYRIQIFLGPLTEAKKERARFIASFPDESCYVVQNIPDHAVRVGDFRNLPEAQKFLKKYKLSYPGAFIAQDKIEMPRLRRKS